MRRTFLFILLLLLTGLCFAQEKFWKFEIEQNVPKLNTPQLLIPQIYRTVSLSFDQYKTYLKTAPEESETSIKNGLQIALPYPDNSFKKFKVVETRMMEKGLARQFPEIKTYIGQGIDEPAASVRIDFTYQGFHAYVISPDGALFIDPYQKANTNLYITYLSKDYKNPLKENFKCTLADNINLNSNPILNTPLSDTCIGSQLKTYRAAISCTGEYAEAVCPVGKVTLANTTSAIVTTMNRINGVYQTELAIKFVLVAADASIIYTDFNTDPYSGNSDAFVLLNESQANITSVIGSANFDIGHTFSTGAGGRATPGGVCNDTSKAQGVTGNSSPMGDAYDIDFVAHEIGHQFGAGHTFESDSFNCGGPNRIKLSAYEPGSGTTIMSFANSYCGRDAIQSHSNAYFHTKSFDEIIAYTTSGTGSTCASVSATGNHAPVITMPVSGLKVPKKTPFTLTGTATDSDAGNVLTYSWEEWDISNLDFGSPWNSGAFSVIKPLFKVRNPKISGSRTFPDLGVILAGYPASPAAAINGLKGETIPRVARNIKFRFIARDNQADGGGVTTSANIPFKVIVTDDGPFKLTAPNTAVNWLGGSIQTITWDVANTNDATGINAQNVDILMSTNGGNTFSTIVSANTPNDGTEDIEVPNIPTNTTVRFKVQASKNIFFDISDVNSTITFNSVLPVSLLQFSVKPARNSIQLVWATATEINNKGFEILRSERTNNNFIKIGFVSSINNSAGVQNYTFNDSIVKKGVDYFYRLRQIDIDNNSVYSSVKRAKIDAEGKFAVIIQPQPFRNTAEVFIGGIEKKNFIVIISDIMGRIIIKKEIKNNEENRLI
ncbi:MAG: reprolysin-like metallopeptidase, partial [Ginsengibacter sp.]